VLAVVDLAQIQNRTLHQHLGWRRSLLRWPPVSGLPGVFGRPALSHARPSGAAAKALCWLNATFAHPNAYPIRITGHS
jgi:hypothetical protein